MRNQPVLRLRGKGKFWHYRFKHHGISYAGSTKTANRAEAEAITAKVFGSLKSEDLMERVKARRAALTGVISTTQRASSIGAVGEKLVCIDLMTRGFAVFEAASPNSPCDLVFLSGCGRIIRVEVKVGERTKKGTKHGKIRPTCEYDVLAVVTRSHGIIYDPPINDLIPTEEYRHLPKIAQLGDTATVDAKPVSDNEIN